ncbi:MAG: uroporphyrinogen decarboxylase family protein, partial [Candidatus Latescibacterota bacterium]
GRLEGARPALARHAASRYVAGCVHMVAYERLHCLRGMANTFADFYLYPSQVERLLDALTDYCVALVGAWGRLDGVDALFLTDDWGTQQALMVSPQMWRSFFAARYRRVCDAAHAAGLQVIFHSCGNVSAIVGDLIDAGVDVIDPLQPEAMDLGEIARRYGGRVAFCGGLSDQAIAHQTPQQVRDTVRRTLDTLGRACGHAYLVGPSNVLTPEIPLANVEAVFQACHEG